MTSLIIPRKLVVLSDGKDPSYPLEALFPRWAFGISSTREIIYLGEERDITILSSQGLIGPWKIVPGLSVSR